MIHITVIYLICIIHSSLINSHSAVLCSTVAPPENGALYFDTEPVNEMYSFGTKAFFNCSNGYAIEGPSKAQCNAEGIFLPASPICSRKIR